MPIARESNENKVAHAIATHSRLATHKWRHRVRIKDLFVDSPTHESVDALCRRAVKEIEAVADSEDRRRDQKSDDERQYFTNQLRTLASDFDANIGAAEGETVEDRVSQFDYMLSELYDIGDVKIELRDGTLQKFMWVD